MLSLEEAPMEPASFRSFLMGCALGRFPRMMRVPRLIRATGGFPRMISARGRITIVPSIFLE
jgi:hypothetical protein